MEKMFCCRRVGAQSIALFITNIKDTNMKEIQQGNLLVGAYPVSIGLLLSNVGNQTKVIKSTVWRLEQWAIANLSYFAAAHLLLSFAALLNQCPPKKHIHL